MSVGLIQPAEDIFEVWNDGFSASLLNAERTDRAARAAHGNVHEGKFLKAT